MRIRYLPSEVDGIDNQISKDARPAQAGQGVHFALGSYVESNE
jgi:hypothetical protein